MLKSILTALALLGPGASASATPSQAGAAGCAEATSAGSCDAVATERRPAVVQVQDAADGGAALEVTARPLAADAATPFLVQVYVDESSRPRGAAPELLGSFSFLPARPGQVQTFVLPKPALADTASAKDVTLAIKLIPANPARGLGNSAVEILGARLVDH